MFINKTIIPEASPPDNMLINNSGGFVIHPFLYLLKISKTKYINNPENNHQLYYDHKFLLY